MWKYYTKDLERLDRLEGVVMSGEISTLMSEGVNIRVVVQASVFKGSFRQWKDAGGSATIDVVLPTEVVESTDLSAMIYVAARKAMVNYDEAVKKMEMEAAGQEVEEEDA